MESCNADCVGGFFADLVNLYNRDFSFICGMHVEVRPTAVFVAALLKDAAGDGSIGKKPGATRFVRGQGFKLAAAYF